MYEVTYHRGNKLNDMIRVEAHDTDVNGAASCFEVYLKRFGVWEKLSTLRFQNVPLIGPNEQEVPPSGLSNECLIAIVIDRLEKWQFDKARGLPGKFACSENEQAITSLKTALLWLRERSRERKDRGVEGTHQK